MAAEAETDRTRNMTVELRRKLDDAHAALHELGRENQSIQVGKMFFNKPKSLKVANNTENLRDKI